MARPKQVPLADVDIVTLAAETMTGDLRDFLLDRLKHHHNPIPWQLQPEREQRETIRQAEVAARAWVDAAATLIAADGAKAARGSLIKLQSKDGLQLQVNIPAASPLRHELMDAVGSTVLVTILDPEKFAGERASVPVTKDQRDILDEPDDVAAQ
jgi:hypothetical protein